MNLYDIMTVLIGECTKDELDVVIVKYLSTGDKGIAYMPDLKIKYIYVHFEKLYL